jgi:predicted DNA-binding transcriptional regulator AlpA
MVDQGKRLLTKIGEAEGGPPNEPTHPERPGRFPEVGFVRLPQIIGDARAIPPIPAVIPVSRSTWWEGVKTGRFPKPVKLGPRTTAWRVEDILSLIKEPWKQL